MIFKVGCDTITDVRQDTISGAFVSLSLRSQPIVVGKSPVVMDLPSRCLGGHAGDHCDRAFTMPKRSQGQRQQRVSDTPHCVCCRSNKPREEFATMYSFGRGLCTVCAWQRSDITPPKGYGFVYFVQADDQHHLIKIGYSTSIKQRMNTLLCDSPVSLRLVGIVVGKKDLEQSLHQRFARSLSHREWFFPTPDLVEYIQAESVEIDFKAPGSRFNEFWLSHG